MKNSQLIEQAMEIASRTAIEHVEKMKLEEQKQKRDRRLRNTRMLLRNYRSFKLHCEDIKMDLDFLRSKDFLEELETDEFAVESIKRSKERTLTMIRFIDQMLNVYKTICDQSDREEDRRRYEVIEKLYISEPKMTIEEVAACQSTNVRTVYRDVNEAVKTLSVLVFGVDGIRLVSG